MPLLLGLGGNNTEEILETINETNFDGIDGILSVCPYYNKPSQEGVYRHYVALADACPVPVLLYNIPGRTGINMSVQTISRLSLHPNIFGVKEASGDLTHCMEIMRHTSDDFMLIAGDDLLAIPMISIGAKGAIAVLPNVLPERFSTMIRAALQNDFEVARRLLLGFTDLNPLLYAEGNPVGAKAVLSLMGECEPCVRLPLAEASIHLLEELKAVLDKMAVAEKR